MNENLLYYMLQVVTNWKRKIHIVINILLKSQDIIPQIHNLFLSSVVFGDLSDCVD